jgi:hypothetical protein
VRPGIRVFSQPDSESVLYLIQLRWLEPLTAQEWDTRVPKLRGRCGFSQCWLTLKL